MSIKGIIACFLVISLLSVSAVQISATSQTTASVLIDFGNGNAYWADVPVGSGMNAFNLTIEATTALNLPIDYSVFSWGISVNSIGNSVAEYPNEWWHFWLWNSTTNAWMMSTLGAASVNATSYTAYAWSFVQDRADYSAPVPQSDPVNRYSWEQSRHDNFNTGFSNVTTSISNDTVFSTNLNNGKIDPAVVVSGQKVYVVTEGVYNWTSYSYDKSPKVFCLNQNGAVVWSENITGGGYQLASPLVVGGQLIVPSTDGTVFSFNAANGSRLWTYSVPISWTGVTSSPIVYRDQIIIASGDGNVTALAMNGTKLWNTKIASSIYFSAPAAKDGIIYIGSDDLKLHAVYANGSGEAWNVTVPGKVKTSPLLLDDKIVITYAVYNGFVAINGGVAAYNYTGTQLWNVNINSTSSSPAWTTKGLVVTSVTGVTMVSESGAVLWAKNLGVVKSSPSVSRSGIYLVSYGSPAAAYMLDLNGKIVFNKTLAPADYSMSSPAIANGRVYLASDNGYVYCLENLPPVLTLSSAVIDNLKVTFTAQATSAEPVTVTWDFGDGNSSSGLIVNHTYARAGNYSVAFWASDVQGGNASDLFSVNVSPAKEADNTTLYAVVAAIAIVLVGAIILFYIRGKKK
jgi:outer membrane protein assembly factor BamB